MNIFKMMVIMSFLTVSHFLKSMERDQSRSRLLSMFIRDMEKERNKRIASQNKGILQSEQEEIDRKADEKLQSASRVPLKIVHIDPRASQILQVMAEVHNHIKIHNRLEIYDNAISIIQREEEIRNYGRVIGSFDKSLGYLIAPSKL
jgi:hypothetical protein